MEVAHLNQKQLAARWCISAATLERWRSAGIGPKFLKLCGRVLCHLLKAERMASREIKKPQKMARHVQEAYPQPVSSKSPGAKSETTRRTPKEYAVTGKMVEKKAS